jgi:hypothetical protein
VLILDIDGMMNFRKRFFEFQKILKKESTPDNKIYGEGDIVSLP